MRTLFTSESVTEGHPDKLCDQVSDAVLDAILAQDPMARVACETFATTGIVQIMGEITTTAQVNLDAIARKTIVDIGYDKGEMCFDGNTCAVLTSVHAQSPDICQGVDNALETRDGEQKATGAGDQGMMFGYACLETPEMMPLPIALSHRLTRRLAEVRKNGTLPWLRPDGKAQVTVVYQDGVPERVETVVVSTQHSPDVSEAELHRAIREQVIAPVIPAELLREDTRFFINPTGRFVLGGPAGDTGLTGRKIIVDTYGGFARHGGGCFSGKDPSKVDRSAAYAARWVAKNVVAAGLAGRCELQLAYAIGVAEPVSIQANTFGTGVLSDEELSGLIARVFDLTPDGIISALNLRRPIYLKTAAYGHFGREEEEFTWEKLNRVEELKAAAGLK